MKGTKLWQSPGSPLISGRSRQHRPFVRTWLGAWAFSEVLFVGALVAAAAISGGGRVDVSQSLAPWLWSALAALPGTGGGAALGVSVARVIGWRRQTVAGTVFGVFGGALLAWAVYRLR